MVPARYDAPALFVDIEVGQEAWVYRYEDALFCVRAQVGFGESDQSLYRLSGCRGEIDLRHGFSWQPLKGAGGGAPP